MEFITSVSCLFAHIQILILIDSFICLQIFEKYVQNWIAIAAPFQGETSEVFKIE